MTDREELRERNLLAVERLMSLTREHELEEPYGEYFRRTAGFILNGTYDDLKPERYEKAYVNPVYAVSLFGMDMGRLLSFLAYELTAVIPFKAEGDIRLEDITILSEVFLEIYTAFIAETETGISSGSLVSDVHTILKSFITDYTDVTVEGRIRELVDPSRDFAKRIIMEADLNDLSYLDRFGEYVTDDTRELAAFINSFSEEEIKRMAETFTQGFITGFAATGKDITKKKTVNIRYNLGFERLVRASAESFAGSGLDVTIYRKPLHAAVRGGLTRVGYYGELVNEQMDYDHREDEALFLDRAYVERKLEVLDNAYSKVRDLAAVFAGPAVMERFGMKEFIPVNHNESLRLTDKQTKLRTELASRSAEIQNKYIPGDERSFTIISYPVPETGAAFPEIFRETVEINTLPAERWKEMQQCIIEQLEKGEYVEIKGKNGNRTDMRIQLHPAEDISSESVFENCTADVNIPVGEVFTSPKLGGTDGVLHVSRVYINGLIFRELQFTFKDGFVTDYSCADFQSAEENRRYIEENILFHHDTLPMGEFAIGTNTTAYMMAKKYGIFDKLPILIAEKTGPHFALGDTCYSREEDKDTFNPDGRRLIAKDNEHTLKYRREEPLKAYFQCHTDITLPYEELGEIASVDAGGKRYVVIKDGLFTVPGTEKLNEPLQGILRA
ncbi:MAG: aminopeptidase [Lachnospiraceae bacterium]|nr:aminopeptidase [Lachnospiraceae bacterium]